MLVATLIAIAALLTVGTLPAEGFGAISHRKAVLYPSKDSGSVPRFVTTTPTEVDSVERDEVKPTLITIDFKDVAGGDKAWKGGFIQRNPELNYKQLEPHLSSLKLMGNTENIGKLDRMQRVRWPEFSWTRDAGDPNSRCYLRFYDNISRIAYTKEGRIYSIICPQMGVDLTDFGLPGTFNIEVHVNGTRGWVDEDTKTICGEMIVSGLIWIDMNEEEKDANPVIAALEDTLSHHGKKFPFTKETALVVPTHYPFQNWNRIVPVRNGTTTNFPLPSFTQHWQGETVEGTKLDLFGVANIPSQVGNPEKTNIPAVDDFNEILLDINNIALAGILTEGNIIDWNLWTTPPEIVNQTEYAKHAEDFRHSIDVHDKKNELDISRLRNYDGKEVFKRDLVKQFWSNRAMFGKIKKYLKEHHPDPKSMRAIRAFLWMKGFRFALNGLNPIRIVDRLVGRTLGRYVNFIPGIHAPRTGVVSTMRRGLSMDMTTSLPYFGYAFGHPFKTRMKIVRLFPFRQVIGWPNIVGKPKTEATLEWHANNLVKTGDFRSKDGALPDNYHFFGSMDTIVDELILSLRTNPFFVSALTRSHEGYYELNSYDPEGKNGNRFLQAMNTLPDSNAGRRVNFRFNKDMTEIISFTVYEGGKNGEPSIPRTYDPKTLETTSIIQDMAGAAMYNLLFYQALIHSTFHTLHYVMLQSWVEASRAFKPMKKWAKWYNKGILSVYFIQSISLDEVFFGNYGYNATKSVGQALLKDTLNSFGQSPSANNFFSSFFQLSRKEMEDADVLTEFFKHFDLIQGFSQEASDALKEIDSSKFRSVQSALVHKLKKDCGEFESNIQNFEEFLQLLSVTSLIHGSTRTLARYFGTYSVMRWNSPNHDKWTASDATLMGSLSPGGPIHEDRHLMSIAREAGQFPRELSSVLEYYDSNSTQLKLKYQKEIRQDPAFDKLGFLLTDYCIGGLDGKQVTSCTYN